MALRAYTFRVERDSRAAVAARGFRIQGCGKVCSSRSCARRVQHAKPASVYLHTHPDIHKLLSLRNIVPKLSQGSRCWRFRV